jgi:hypothetical protein
MPAVSEKTPLKADASLSLSRSGSPAASRLDAFYRDRLRNTVEDARSATSKRSASHKVRCCCCAPCPSPCCEPDQPPIQDYADFAGEAQLAIISSLQSQSSVSYDASNGPHVEELKGLWAAAWTAGALPTSGGAAGGATGDVAGAGVAIGAKDERWKLLGFQSADPASDFRAAGLLGLRSLTYLAKRRGDELAELLRGHREHPELAFPWAATALNVHFLLVGRLKLADPKGPARMSPFGKGESDSGSGGREDLRTACWLICEAETQRAGGGAEALHEIFCCAMQFLDLLWHRLLIAVDAEREAAVARGGAAEARRVIPAILRFNQAVLKPLWGYVRALLEQGPRDVNELRRLCELEIGRPC